MPTSHSPSYDVIVAVKNVRRSGHLLMKKTRGIVRGLKAPMSLSLSQGDTAIAMTHWKPYLMKKGPYVD